MLFPSTILAAIETGFLSWIHKDQSRKMNEGFLDEFSVTTFDDPAVRRAFDKRIQLSDGILDGQPPLELSPIPGDGVEIENFSSRLTLNFIRERGLPRPRIADNGAVLTNFKICTYRIRHSQL